MLGKLIKHDFISTRKVFISTSILLVAITLFGSLSLGTHLLQRQAMMPLSLSLLVIYILMILSINTITTLYLVVYFYRNLFSPQGYLSFTLPVSPWSLLHAKIIVGTLWHILITILVTGSALAMVISTIGYQEFANFMQQLFYSQTITTLDGELSTITSSVSVFNFLGYTPIQFVIIVVAFFLSSCIYSVSMGYASVTLGQLYSKHKVAGIVVAYIALQIITQIITSIVSIIIMFQTMLHPSTYDDMLFARMYKPFFPTLIFIYVAFSFVYYIVSGYIMNRKLNLS